MIDYEKEAAKLGRLVQEKQAAYGDSFGKSEQIFKILYPDGVKPENYKDFLTLVRMVDKMFRIATKKDAFGENPFMDIQGYALLASAKEEAMIPKAYPKVETRTQPNDQPPFKVKVVEIMPKEPLTETQIHAMYNKEIETIKASGGEAMLKSMAMNDARRWLDDQLDKLPPKPKPKHQYDRDMEKVDLEVELASRARPKCLCYGVGCSDCA